MKKHVRTVCMHMHVLHCEAQVREASNVIHVMVQHYVSLTDRPGEQEAEISWQQIKCMLWKTQAVNKQHSEHKIMQPRLLN